MSKRTASRDVSRMVAAQCALATDGYLIGDTGRSDEHEVDLVFTCRGDQTALDVQVAVHTISGSRRSGSGRRTFKLERPISGPRTNLSILALLWDPKDRDVVIAWLIPSTDLAAAATQRTSHLIINVNDDGDIWSRYRCSRGELAERVIANLESLGGLAE